ARLPAIRAAISPAVGLCPGACGGTTTPFAPFATGAGAAGLATGFATGLASGLATGCALAFRSGLAVLGFATGLRAARFFFAAGFAFRAFAFGWASFFPAFLRVGCPDFRPFAADPLWAGLRWVGRAGDLRAGFLAMVILSDRVPHCPTWGRTEKPQILSC